MYIYFVLPLDLGVSRVSCPFAVDAPSEGHTDCVAGSVDGSDGTEVDGAAALLCRDAPLIRADHEYDGVGGLKGEEESCEDPKECVSVCNDDAVPELGKGSQRSDEAKPVFAITDQVDGFGDDGATAEPKVGPNASSFKRRSAASIEFECDATDVKVCPVVRNFRAAAASSAL